MSLPSRRSFTGVTSPSNVVLAALVGFLFVGHGTDWKILRGRSARSVSAFAPAWLDHHSSESTKRQPPLLRASYSPPTKLQIDARSEIVDRRAPVHATIPHDFD